MTAKQCQFTMSYLLKILLPIFIVAYGFFPIFLLHVHLYGERSNELFGEKTPTFHILSSSPEPLDQCQPNLALSPTG